MLKSTQGMNITSFHIKTTDKNQQTAQQLGNAQHNLVSIRYMRRVNILDIMELLKERFRESPTLTDYSFVEYRPIRDLYQLLLFDQQEPLEQTSHQNSLEQQLSNEDSDPTLLQIIPLSPPSPLPKTNSHRCNCTKSKCSKNYCQCFRAGRQCSEECCCTNCSNSSLNIRETALQNAIISGCNCRKTHCLKKYCQCHSKGLKCTSQCNCLDCQNTIILASEAVQSPTAVIEDFYL